jgi:flagellar hook assembly protein FlgD
MIAKSLNLISVTLVSLVVASSIAYADRQTYADLTTPPADSAEAERVRIWVPIQRQSRCRLTIDILNDSNRVIRHLVDRLISEGYYNFYWDKKDDSGMIVKPGAYAYVLNELLPSNGEMVVKNRV